MGSKSNRSMPPATVIPELAYPDVRDAVAWLCRTFGFREWLRIGDHRAQLSFGDGSLVVTRLEAVPHAPSPAGRRTHAVMVRVVDVEGHYEQARRAGAKIISPPADFPYGERQYTADDPAGHRWTFSQSIADVDPAEWGGKLV